MSRPFKRRKLSSAEKNSYEEHARTANDQSDSHSDLASGDGDESPDTADEIEHLRQKKSKKTAKRKLRATGAVPFGAALQSLLNTDAPSSLPLSLKPSIARKKNDEKLEQKAKRVLHVERKDKEDKNRIRDVIGGWGGEGERALRKVAQRGVVKLFNVIQQAQASTTASAEEKKAMRGSGKPTLAAPDIERKNKHRKKGKNKDNVLGRGQEKDAVDKDQFFDLIKSGGIVSRA
ncbi:hypothetical protein APHAL10511_006451 [Amanita phalloides]|nr:hypothetical protein APHAL10511_006451 [Amanita phalloides]